MNPVTRTAFVARTGHLVVYDVPHAGVFIGHRVLVRR